MIHGIIFDKDGTLFDFRRSWGAWSAHLLREIAGDEAQARRLGEEIGYDLDSGSFSPESPVIASTHQVAVTSKYAGAELVHIQLVRNIFDAGAPIPCPGSRPPWAESHSGVSDERSFRAVHPRSRKPGDPSR